MTKPTSNKFSPELREQAGRMVLPPYWASLVFGEDYGGPSLRIGVGYLSIK